MNVKFEEYFFKPLAKPKGVIVMIDEKMSSLNMLYRSLVTFCDTLLQVYLAACSEALTLYPLIL